MPISLSSFVSETECFIFSQTQGTISSLRSFLKPDGNVSKNVTGFVERIMVKSTTGTDMGYTKISLTLS